MKKLIGIGFALLIVVSALAQDDDLPQAQDPKVKDKINAARIAYITDQCFAPSGSAHPCDNHVRVQNIVSSIRVHAALGTWNFFRCLSLTKETTLRPLSICFLRISAQMAEIS